MKKFDAVREDDVLPKSSALSREVSVDFEAYAKGAYRGASRAKGIDGRTCALAFPRCRKKLTREGELLDTGRSCIASSCVCMRCDSTSLKPWAL